MFSHAQPALAQGLPSDDSAKAAAAAGAAGSGSDELEELYDKDEQKAPAKVSTKNESKPIVDRKASPEAQTLSDLAKLAPFSDVAVIQRRFLPKTHRFEASVSAFTNLNNPFFSSYGLGLDLAYYFREQWAIEGIAQAAASASRQVTDDLSKDRKIATSNLVTSNGFYGGAIKWNPIYGKITWLNRSIVPFDLNFNLGGGITHTVDSQSVGTVHFGTSQVFALTKGMALRWDFSWNIYQANAKDDGGKAIKLTQNDIYLGLGMSFYFPEASYR